MKRTPLGIGLVLALAAACCAQQRQPQKPNTLTPDEIAQGWILLFDGETTFGWKADGDVRVDAEALAIGGAADSSAETTTQFPSFELKFQYTGEKTEAAALVLNGHEYKLPPTPQTGPRAMVRATVAVETRGDSHAVTTEFAGGRPDTAAARKETVTRPGPSRTTIAFRVPAGARLVVRNLRLRPLAAKSIFNGKDLTGWKPVADKRSKFSVTPAGELNIRDGGGEIQTEGQWDDFVLQIEIFSNGKHLNSGIFFRALPGEFWQGYEAQIRNQWEGDNRSKPVDYGTGGIYNRQPARRVVSSDKEWFTMTVVAHGLHIATWVNGYQVTDYVDKQPAARSARQGSRTDKGVISLQGHDPTTDLSFRNIRVAEFPKAEKAK